jgi:YggT family protein
MSSLIHFLGQIVGLVLTIYMLLIVVRVVVSLIAPNVVTPLMTLTHKITEPLFYEIRRYLPPIGNIDFSPLVALIALWLLRALIVSLFNGLATLMRI